jgi:dipeptidyl aminopeptidase/acylaminoacyl peptidase
MGLLLLLVIAALLSISLVVGWQSTHPKRKPVTTTPASLGLAFEPVQFRARIDQLRLDGWYLPAKAPSTKAVIISHGYKGNRLEEGANALGTAKLLTENGYNVLMFDYRASGNSEGDVAAIGALEKRDLAGAVDYVRSRGNQKVGLLGYSMGAGTSLVVAAELPEVDAVVADSGLRDLEAYLKEKMPIWTNLPDFPFTQIILWTIPPLIGVDLKEMSPIDVAPALAKKPVLLIHGDADETIPPTNSEAVFAAYRGAGGTKGKLLIFPGAKHAGAAKKDPARYHQELLAFFGEYLQ